MHLLRGILYTLIFAVVSGTAQPPTRTLQGVVRASNGEALKGVVVQLKDVQTLAIRSSLTESGGEYRFRQVSPDRDYEVKASFRERWSSAKYISRFVEGDPVIADLTIPPTQ